MDKKEIEISIIIPVKNGANTVENCIQGIIQQTLFYKTEIIIIDSGSTDGTIEILKKYPVRLYQILPEEFNHGATRNYGVSLATGEFVVMTVQDATPVGDKWLEAMSQHYDDPLVAGVCGQQIVPHHKDKNPHNWFRPQNKPSVDVIQKKNMPDNYIPRGWDDVNAMYRKSVLLSIPFKKVEFGEDFLWATDAFKAGRKLVFDTHSRVEHYHHATPQYVYTRITTELYFEYQHFKTITSYPIQIKELFLIIYRNFKYRAHPKWIWHNWMIQVMKYKAWKDFRKAIINDTLENFFAPFKANVPQGQNNNK